MKSIFFIATLSIFFTATTIISGDSFPWENPKTEEIEALRAAEAFLGGQISYHQQTVSSQGGSPRTRAISQVARDAEREERINQLLLQRAVIQNKLANLRQGS